MASPSQLDSDYSDEGEVSSSHSSEADQNDIYPPDFPLSPAVYEQHEIAEDEAQDEVSSPVDGAEAMRDMYKLAKLESLFPYEFLDPNGIWQTPRDAGVVPLGQLRKETIRAMARSGGAGQWQFIEFVPPWTDPDWSNRFVFTGKPGKDLVNDPQYVIYAKKGILQTQRPALRDEDAARNPTAAAKRYGVDPTQMDDPGYGKSGVTPTQGSFSVPLGNPRVTPSNQGLKAVIDKDDFDVMFYQYRNAVAGRGGYATEDDFKVLLSSVAGGNPNPELGEACDSQIANALLQYMNGADRLALQDEYQRLIFGGSSANELVETGVWTMDKTANTDLVTPLHDFFTRDKWQVTTDRGASDPGVVPHDTRKVYNFPGQQGEYCAICKANDYFWLAIQPALQLASMILNSDHPATWAWADIYRMRPCQDSRQAGPEKQDIREIHRAAGVTRKEHFAVYLKEDPDEFYPEIARLKEMGFESIRWVCGILKECLVWELNAKYTESWGQSMPWGSQMAWTKLSMDNSAPNRPFNIRISLSVDYIWPLLVEEYSQAEKACVSFALASCMVHELCHAIVFARCQLFHPDTPWLRFNPNWAAELDAETLRLLKAFGYRQLWDDSFSGQEPLIVRQEDGFDYFEEEFDSEEGWATEAQYWGGAPLSLCKGGFLPESRFLSEIMTMVAFDSWPRLEVPVYKAIPFNMIEKLFSQSFWDRDLQKWGPEAMKMWPLTGPRAFTNWTVFNWRQVELRFGWPARQWLRNVTDRVKYDYDHAMLWSWLRQLTRLAVEPKMCMIRWNKQQKEWKMTDKLLWNMRNDCKDKADRLIAYLQQLYNEIYSGQPMQEPMPPIDYRYFREAFAALSGMHRTLSHEASVYQLIAVDYHRQTDPQTKADIQGFYATNLRARLDGIHSRIAADCISFLDLFQSVDQMVLLRISQSEQAVELMDSARMQLREKFVAIQHAIRPVRLSFDENPQAYVFNIHDFANVAPINAQDTAKQIERTARQQLKTLTGPLLTIAQGWISILERGERLRHAAAGTPEAELNRKLTGAVEFIAGLKQRQQEAVEQQYPPEPANMPRMLEGQGLLQQNQGIPDASMRMQRFNTVSQQGQINPWQTMYAEASGFVPYQDPRTGLTRFYRANIPTEAGPSVNPMQAAQAQAQGQSLVGAFAPGFSPGGNAQDPGWQPMDPADYDAAFRELMQGLNVSPQGPAAPPNIQSGFAGQPVDQGNALNAMSALIGERGRQLQANQGLAGHVVPSMYNRALQTVAGPNGAALVNNNVPGANYLFGGPAAQNSMANQQMEALIRQQALGPDPFATLGNMAAQQGGPQVPGGGFAPANQLYDPVGANAFPMYQQGQPQYQQQFIPTPSQNPFPPQGGFGAPNVFPPPQAPPFPPPGGYQGPNVFPPPQAPFPTPLEFQNPQQHVPPQAPFQGGFQGQQQYVPPQAPFPPQGGVPPQGAYGPPGMFPNQGGAWPQGPGNPGAPQPPRGP